MGSGKGVPVDFERRKESGDAEPFAAATRAVN